MTEKVIYTPEKGASDVTEQYGYTFANGKPTEVEEGFALTKFRGNPFFKVVETKAKKAKKGESATEGDGGEAVQQPEDAGSAE